MTLSGFWPASLASLMLCVSGCSVAPQPETLLVWTDPDTSITVRVATRPTGVKTNSRLEIVKRDAHRERLIDDDAHFGTVSFVKYYEWLLVLNNKYVLAGYSYQEDRLYGEGDWDKLPFTVRTSAGTVVAARKIGESFGLPMSFPRIEEPTSINPVEPTRAPDGARGSP